MKIIFETERTYLREIFESDAQDFFELDSDPEVHRYLGNNPVTHLKQSEDVISYVLQQYKDFGIGRLAVIEKESGKFIGWSGLKYETLLRPKQPYYDLGYRFKKKYWGKGFATETAFATLDYGFNVLKLPWIGAAADVENAASNHILKKLGMQYLEDFHFEGAPCHFYSVQRADWKNPG